MVLGGGAFAANAVYVEPTYEVVDTAFNWSSVYVGAMIGYSGAPWVVERSQQNVILHHASFGGCLVHTLEPVHQHAHVRSAS